MARKYGKVATISKNFYDYNYIITGVASIGKTHLAHHLGIAASDSNEGTFIITCGREPMPTHIPNNPFFEHATTFKEIMDIVKDVSEHRNDYPDTKFICIDSIDELYRCAEEHVVKEWNAQCEIKDRAKSISQAYKGFQKGENRVCDLVVKLLGTIEDAGLHWIMISHTKSKTQTDMYSGVSFEQITSSVDAKYYNLVKDKANLVATCYFEKEIADIEEVKDAFTKKMKKKGNLISQKKIIVFRDDDNAIDCKSHFAYIEPKIDFSVENFIKAVTDAIEQQIKHSNTLTTSKKSTTVEDKPKKVIEETPAPEPEKTPDPDPIDEDDLDPDTFEDITSDEDTFDIEAYRDEIRTKFKASKDKEVRDKVREILAEKCGKKLDNADKDVLDEINAIL